MAIYLLTAVNFNQGWNFCEILINLWALSIILMTGSSSFTEFIALALNDTFSYNSDEMAHYLPSLFLIGI